MIRAAAIVLCLWASAAGAADTRNPALPDPERTPGALNPAVTQANIKRTICRPGWTKTVRPSNGYFRDLKRHQIEEWGLPEKRLGAYEEDHLVSLQLGGHPRNPKNLWPQPYQGACGARVKDVLETRLKRLVCAGKLSLADAQAAIMDDWIAAYRRYVPKPGRCGV